MLEPQSAARVHAAGQWPGYRKATRPRPTAADAAAGLA